MPEQNRLTATMKTAKLACRKPTPKRAKMATLNDTALVWTVVTAFSVDLGKGWLCA